jgi:hypothetical protein
MLRIGGIKHTTGPFIGPILQILKARARYFSVTISETVPGAFEIIAAPMHALFAVELATTTYIITR